jgi:hypothetical protein
MKPLFNPGREVMTASVSEWSAEGDKYSKVLACLKRHLTGDWGNVSFQDQQGNDEALIHGDRLHSVYTVADKTLWIITEGKRDITTILFPSDY